MRLALWSVSDTEMPLRLHQGHQFLERDLEDWIEKDPALVMEGLRWAGRQVRFPDGTSLDLIGVTREGQLVICELKQTPVNIGTLAQALHYVMWLGSLDIEALSARTGRWQEGGPELLREAFPPGEPVPILILLAGTGRDASVDGAAEFLKDRGFSVDVRIVTFTPFLSPSKEVFLAREAEDHEGRPEGGAAPTFTVERVLEVARQFGVDDVVRECLDTAARLGLPSRPWRQSITIGPPGAANRTLLYCGPHAPGIIAFGYSAEYFDRLGIDPELAAERLGPNWIYPGEAEFRSKLTVFETLVNEARARDADSDEGT